VRLVERTPSLALACLQADSDLAIRVVDHSLGFHRDKLRRARRRFRLAKATGEPPCHFPSNRCPGPGLGAGIHCYLDAGRPHVSQKTEKNPAGRGVVWSSSRIELGDTSVLDAEFLAEQLVVLLESVVVGCQSDAGVDAVGGPAASSHDGAVGQGNDVQNG